MSIVLVYDAFDVKRLLASNEREEAGAMLVVLLALLLIGFIVFALSLNILNNYGGLNYPPGVKDRLSFYFYLNLGLTS